MGKPEGAGGATMDPRFAKMLSDPRFQRFPKKKNLVEIDSRFSGEGARRGLWWCAACLRRRQPPQLPLPPLGGRPSRLLRAAAAERC